MRLKLESVGAAVTQRLRWGWRIPSKMTDSSAFGWRPQFLAKQTLHRQLECLQGRQLASSRVSDPGHREKEAKMSSVVSVYKLHVTTLPCCLVAQIHSDRCGKSLHEGINNRQGSRDAPCWLRWKSRLTAQIDMVQK